MGRPTKARNEISRPRKIRATDEEWAAVLRDAKASGRSASKYVMGRTLLRRSAQRPHPCRPIDLHHLARIDGLLSEICDKISISAPRPGKVDAPELLQQVTELRGCLDAIQKELGMIREVRP